MENKIKEARKAQASRRQKYTKFSVFPSELSRSGRQVAAPLLRGLKKW